jgi:CRISPR/Cas system-associated exonuclease Cas4 (RecB family)
MYSKLEKMNLSWSAFESYETCPFKFYQKYVEGKKEATNIYALYGCALHVLLDNIYTTQKFNSRYVYSIWERTLQGEYKLSSKQEQYREITQEAVDKIKWMGFRDIKNFFELAIEENILIPAKATEQTIRGNYKNHKLVCKIDLEIELPKYGNTLLDWKSGKEDKNSFYQLTLYAALYQKKKNKQIDTIAPVYIKNKKIYYRKIDKELKKEVGEYISRIYDSIMTDKIFLPKKNAYCSTCYLKNICKI